MKWKQHKNSKELIYNRPQIQDKIHKAAIELGVLRNTFLQYSSKTQIKTYRKLILATLGSRQWYLHLRCSWQYKSAEMINYSIVDQVFCNVFPMKSRWLHTMEKHIIQTCHMIWHTATSGTTAEAYGFKSNKAARRLAAKSETHHKL